MNVGDGYNSQCMAGKPPLRIGQEYYGEQTMIFPSTAGTWRDPNNFNRDWRRVRDELALPDVTSHSFRKRSQR